MYTIIKLQQRKKCKTTNCSKHTFFIKPSFPSTAIAIESSVAEDNKNQGSNILAATNYYSWQ